MAPRSAARSLLQREIRQSKPFASRAEEAFLNLQRTSSLHMQALSRFLRPHRLTPTQYNALRILRGAHPEALPCSTVGNRMVTPVPDVTRLLDRLESRRLVARSRDEQDRRVVRAEITEDGLAALAALDEPLDGEMEELLGHLSDRELTRLIGLLEKARQRLETID